jgi:hypothetical protein
MELQLVSAMLVILFFILYREQKRVHKETSKELRNEVDRLHRSIGTIQANMRSLSDKVVIIYDNPEKPILKDHPDSAIRARPDERPTAAVR